MVLLWIDQEPTRLDTVAPPSLDGVLDGVADALQPAVDRIRAAHYQAAVECYGLNGALGQ
jgi:hypothetical protein